MTLETKINKDCIWFVVYKNIESTTGIGMKKALKQNNSPYNVQGIKKYGCNHCHGYKEKCRAYLPAD
jgi:hypothetical protein